MGFSPPALPELREFNPSSYPPFPLTARPCIELQTISYRALNAGDAAERARVLSICKDKGFFCLDVANSHADSLARDANKVMSISEGFFKLPIPEKMKFPFGRKPNSLLGYKPAGFVKDDAYGRKGDTVEFMNISKDDIANIQGRVQLDNHDIFTDSPNHEALLAFTTLAHNTGLVILRILAQELGLTPDAFDEMHQFDRPSDSHIRMARGPPRVTNTELEIQSPGHTDFGSITLLFNWLGGLQLWSQSNHGESFDNAIGSDLGPESGRNNGEWLWVKPKPGHIIVNLGDCIVKNTGGILCAGRHRVLPAPGEQGQYPRYSLVYFVRPADDHVVKRLKGGIIPPLKEDEAEEELTAAEWAAKQLNGLRVGAKKE